MSENKLKFTDEEAAKIQPIMEDYLSGYDKGEKDWLGERMAKAMPEKKEAERDEIRAAIADGVSQFDKDMSSLRDSLAAGDTKEEWLADKLSKSQLPEDKKTSKIANQISANIKAGTIKELALNTGMSLAEKLPFGHRLQDMKRVADALRSGKDMEVKQAAAAALVTAVAKGVLPLPKNTPVKALTAVASGGVESAKILQRYADGEIGGNEAVEQIEQVAAVQTAQVLGVMGEKGGRFIGARVGEIVSNLHPVLRSMEPVISTVTSYVGGVVGRFAGEKIGTAVFSAARKLKEYAKPMLESATETLKNVGRSLLAGFAR